MLPSIAPGFRREIPSAMVFFTPAPCNASKHHPLLTSRPPKRRISAPDRGSLPPSHLETYQTADVLFPRIKIVSRASLGRMCDCVTNIDAVTTIPNNSSTLIDRSFQSRIDARSRSRTSSSKSEHHHTPSPGSGPKTK